MLRSILRPATFAGLLTPGEPVAWRQPATPFVHELVAVDLPGGLTVVTTEHTERWGVSSAEVFLAGRENVAALHPVNRQDAGASGVFQGADHNFIGSVILTPGWMASFTPPAGTHTIAFLPTEDTLIIGYDDPEQGEKYFETAEQLYRESDRPVSPQGFIECGGQVMPLDRCGPHPLRLRARWARSCEAERTYAEQSEFLNRVYRDELFTCYAAPAYVFDLGHGPVTAAAWGEGVTSDLPEVDYIFFVATTGQNFGVPFSVVLDIVGILPNAGFFPPRYRVTGWPEQPVMDVLRSYAVALPTG